MAREKKRKGKNRKGTQSDRHVEVQLVPTVQFLHEHVSKALCDEVFGDLRTKERERKWSLFALARFWLAVILEAPPSLGQLLERTRRAGLEGFLPEVAASSEAFFQKCKNLSVGFFMGLYARFIGEVLPKAPKRYCQELAYLKKKFSEVVAIDGSRLDKIAHRLKILQREKAAVLPGCLLAVYDVFRGIATQLWFEADAAAAEFTRGLLAVECLAVNTLVLGDRLYCSVALFRELEANGCFGVFRRNKTVSIEKVRRLSRQRLEIGLLEDWIVQAGRKGTEIELRLVVLKTNGKTYEALTNVLDPERLSAEEVAKLYPYRWTVERLFYDLKVVLNLKKLYAANPNAVGMQVFAAAMVHTAFRIGQADIAKKHDIPPEELSPQKLFPLLALTSIKLLEADLHVKVMQDLNPGVKFRIPSWEDLPHTLVSLRHIRRQRRSAQRKKREYHKDRAKWKSITKVDGAEELT
jgi:hypothetical protein